MRDDRKLNAEYQDFKKILNSGKLEMKVGIQF